VVSSALSPLLDPGFLEATIRRHFAPLLDAAFDEILAPHYRQGVRFRVNGQELARDGAGRVGRVPLAVRLARKRKPSAVGYLERSERPFPEARRGVAISTFGKVIKRGWDWVGVVPAAPDYVCGLIEAPPLSEALALNKADFIRSGSRGATYLVFRKAIQEVVSRQLAEWGDDRPAEPPRPAPVRVRELEQVLERLSGDFPLLGALVEQRRGGQRHLPWRNRGADDAEVTLLPMLVDVDGASTDASSSPGPDESSRPAGETEVPQASSSPEPPPPSTDVPAVELPRGPGVKRPGRYGLHVEFELRPGDLEPARLVDSTVRINEAHPAYRRAAASRSLGYHIGLSVALALAPLAADAGREHQFLTSFLARWGEAVGGSRGRSA
jgi:hypothetical protein